MTKGKPNAGASTLREPTPKERDLGAAVAARQASKPARVSVDLKRADDGAAQLANPHSDPKGWTAAMTDAAGSSSEDFANTVITRLINAATPAGGPTSQPAINAALAMLGGIDPQNEFEAVIAEQIITTHFASLDFLSRSRANANAGHVESAAAYASMGNKTSRTMVAHVEALTKLRSGGKQQVIVKHVYVNGPAIVGDGAQAVFGTRKGGGEAGKLPQPRVASPAIASGAALWSEDAAGGLLPTAGDAREEALLAAWREEPGRAEGQGERSVRARAADPGVEGGAGAGAQDDGDAEG